MTQLERKIMRILLMVIIGCLITGCAIPEINKHVDQLNPYHLNDKKSKTITVSKITDEVGSGKVAGKFHSGTACVSNGNLIWASNEKSFANYGNIIRKKLEENGYSLLGKAFSPFNEQFAKQAEFLLGGRIIGVVANMCYSVKGAKGESYLKIEWEVFDTKSNGIVFKTVTEGYSKAADFIVTGDSEIFGQAFSMAADNLLAEKNFYNLLVPD